MLHTNKKDTSIVDLGISKSIESENNMSQFLAPIHGWLFNKVLLLESLEEDIASYYDDTEIKTIHNQLKDQMGDLLPKAPLEQLIDKSNIHGWLQVTINRAEQRQAALVGEVLKRDEKALELISKIYKDKGRSLADDMSMMGPKDVFTALNNVLLEGMPCDRVHQILEDSPNRLTWHIVTCVHRGNWEGQGVDVNNYYQLRHAFTQGFVEAADHLSYQANIDSQTYTLETL